MPMLITVSIGAPPAPVQSPSRTRSENENMRRRTSWTSGTTS